VSEKHLPVPGEIRKWHYTHYPSLLDKVDGDVFTVVGVEGVRVDVLHNSGKTEGYYLDWLVENSVVIS
jgi:hypothetical protein